MDLYPTFHVMPKEREYDQRRMHDVDEDANDPNAPALESFAVFGCGLKRSNDTRAAAIEAADPLGRA